VPALKAALAAAGVLALAAAAPACKAKASSAQCEQLLDRYASLRVSEKVPPVAGAERPAEEQREKAEARGDDAFKNCTSEVSQAELDCAMRAATVSAFEKCLE
jgi:hypothetical protein